MISLSNANKYFNRFKKNQIHVINNVSLDINNGLVAILGPSGSGKTTLLNVIGGLDKLSSGNIYINNKKFTNICCYKKDKIRNSDIGYIFQDFYLIDDLSVYDNVSLVLKMIGLKDKDLIKKRVDYVLTTLGIYKYRNRPAKMLSGGERQRVAIARAIVKNPSIIIADEPTGNLDSKNTIEIMNIIKSISKEKLVILVTHEKELAYFYSSRIIELEDGKIIKDYVNDQKNELDYRIDNKIYLKDFNNHEIINGKDIIVNYYNDNDEKINIDIVSKNGNIFIKMNKEFDLSNSNNIEFVNDNYKKISKDEYLKYNFDYNNVLNNNFKIKYASIYNPISMIKDGFNKIKHYSILKKILLCGFFISSMFVLYSVCNIAGIIDIKDSEFVSHNKNYLKIETNNLTVEKYTSYSNIDSINYLLPGDSDITFNVKYDFYYQTYNAVDSLKGSISSLEMINNSDIVYGTMPTNKYEIVVDAMSINNMFNNNVAIQVGLTNINDVIGMQVELKNMNKFTIVGIVDLESPSIYMDESLIINALSNTYNDYYYYDYNYDSDLIDYKLYESNIKLVNGNYPGDYEIIVNVKDKELYPINKTIDNKINNTSLKVVGYYESADITSFLSNENTIKYQLIENSKNAVIYPKDKEECIDYFNSIGINVKDIYEMDKEEYLNEHMEAMVSSFIVAFIILLISLVEIYLMIRSSFLSRIKEVGIKRAIGVKKSDIYKMFLGEILVINFTASSLGLILMAYIVKGLCSLPIIKNNFILSPITFIISFIIVYAFNILIGLLPVMFALQKTPHEILSRTDAD